MMMMMMIKLFIMFSAHFLGTIYDTFIFHNELYILIYKPPLYFAKFVIFVLRVRESPCKCGIVLGGEKF